MNDEDSGAEGLEAEDLGALRGRIQEIDTELLERAAERVKLARRIGEIKRSRKRPTIDYAQERQVLERGARLAAERGLDPAVAEDLLARLIQASVTVQEKDSLRAAATGDGKTAVVVGGAGRMGLWFHAFLEAQGWSVAVLDPAADPAEGRRAEAMLPDADLVVCAAPPRSTAALYRRWAETPPAGVVVDVASIKTPLLEAIRELQAAGGRVASIHPMFGPSTALLRDADVVVCDTGDPAATEAVESLFRATTARLVSLSIEEHDRLMADLLSLAHLSALAFALALPEAEHPVRSTTFQALEGLASRVVRESPDVYYEIQTQNPHSREAAGKLRAALERLLEAVERRRPDDFEALMEEGRQRTGLAL